MLLRTRVTAVINRDALKAPCRKAEHAVAVQAERDSRRYIPVASGRLRGSGRVYGNTIIWDLPYARQQYFGHLYVDPKLKIAGFPTKAGWRSFRETKKIRGKAMHHNRGTSQWFTAAKKAHLGAWLRVAQGVIARGG